MRLSDSTRYVLRALDVSGLRYLEHKSLSWARSWGDNIPGFNHKARDFDPFLSRADQR
jgi:hypothetical protein